MFDSFGEKSLTFNDFTKMLCWLGAAHCKRCKMQRSAARM